MTMAQASQWALQCHTEREVEFTYCEEDYEDLVVTFTTYDLRMELSYPWSPNNTQLGSPSPQKGKR